MTTYLIDANIISYLADIDSPFHQKVRKQFQNLNDEDRVLLSVLTLYELQYGLAHAEDADIKSGILRIKEKIRTALPVVPLSGKGAEIFGVLKSKYQKLSGLKKHGLSRHTVDIMIASSAIELDAILVSNDKLFTDIQSREPRLKLDNWAV